MNINIHQLLASFQIQQRTIARQAEVIERVTGELGNADRSLDELRQRNVQLVAQVEQFENPTKYRRIDNVDSEVLLNIFMERKFLEMYGTTDLTEESAALKVKVTTLINDFVTETIKAKKNKKDRLETFNLSDRNFKRNFTRSFGVRNEISRKMLLLLYKSCSFPLVLCLLCMVEKASVFGIFKKIFAMMAAFFHLWLVCTFAEVGKRYLEDKWW